MGGNDGKGSSCKSCRDLGQGNCQRKLERDFETCLRRNVMKKGLVVFVVLLSLVTGWAGCELVTDAVTGKKHVRLDPDEAQKYEEGAEGLMGVLKAFVPVIPEIAVPAVAGLGGLLIMWKKLKPKLVASEEEKNNFVRGGEVLALMLEEIKTKHPEIWKDVGPKIDGLIKDSVSIENAIRGFRHLAPK